MSESSAQHVGSRLSFEVDSTNYGSWSCTYIKARCGPFSGESLPYLVLVVPLTTAGAAMRFAGTALIQPTTENGLR
jgi:hypothetical protein